MKDKMNVLQPSSIPTFQKCFNAMNLTQDSGFQRQVWPSQKTYFELGGRSVLNLTVPYLLVCKHIRTLTAIASITIENNAPCSTIDAHSRK